MHLKQLVRDGVALAFEDLGKGGPPIVLVHELACDRTWFTPQIEHFRHSNRVVAVDLRGHGQSAQPDSGYTITRLVDDLVWLLYELGVHRPVVMGHGIGGVIALDLAARHTDLPAAVVALDAPLLPPLKTYLFLRSFEQRLRILDHREMLRPQHGRLCQTSTTHQCSSCFAHTRSLLSGETLALTLESAIAWDGVLAAASCRVPILYLESGSEATHLGILRQLCPRLTVNRLDCVGQFLNVKDSDQLNTLIDRFIGLLAKPIDGADGN